MQNIYDIVFLNEKSSPKVKHESLKFTNSYRDFLNPKYGRMTCERIEKLLESIRFNFASFLSVRFITAILVNPLERKQTKRTSVHWFKAQNFSHCCYSQQNTLMNNYTAKMSLVPDD